MNSSLHSGTAPAEACFILFFVENFQDVNFLMQFRWFYSNLWKPITCGKTSVQGSSKDWIVTSIVDSDNQSITVRDMHKKNHKGRNNRIKKKKQLYLLPSSSVLFTFSSYRLAICLEISPTMFSVHPNGHTPLDEMSESLKSMLINIHKGLLSQHNISHVYISILAHHAHFTHGLYQGYITKSTPINEVIEKIKPIFTRIEKIISARFDSAKQKSAQFTSFATVSQNDTDECFSPSPVHESAPGYSGGHSPSTTSTTPYDQNSTENNCGLAFFSTTSTADSSSVVEYMSLESICEGLNYYLNLLPENACPVAVLITSGSCTIVYLCKFFCVKCSHLFTS
jgi:hypothetical protein